jgi:hypothetical protein
MEYLQMKNRGTFIMQNRNSRQFIILFLFTTFLASCNLSTNQAPGGSNPPMEPPQEEPTIQVEEPSAPVSNSEPSPPVAEEPPVGGGGPSVESGAQNSLPRSVNLEQSSIDLEKLGSNIIGGGGGNNCSESLDIKTKQEITLWYDGIVGNWKLCFLNFPVGTAQLKLSTQSGYFDTSLFLDPEFEGVEAYALYVNLPAPVLRDGPLEVEFSVENVTFSETFDIQEIDRVTVFHDISKVKIPIVSFEPSNQFQVGDRVEIFGVNLRPSTRVFVGIYGLTEFDRQHFYLVDQFELTTNQDGEFLGTFIISEKYSQGSYLIYYGYEPNLLETPARKNGLDGFDVSNNSAVWQPCQAEYASRLRVGDIGFVNDDPFSPNNVRNTPSLNGELVGQIQPREFFIILDGPVCEGGWVWWYIQSAYDYNKNEALTGWTSEGDSNNYWLLKP